MASTAQELVRLAPLPIAKIYALTAGTLTLVTSVVQFVINSVTYVQAHQPIPLVNFLGGSLLDAVTAVITGSLLGAVIGVLVSFVYNWWAKRIGGAVIELRNIE